MRRATFAVVLSLCSVAVSPHRATADFVVLNFLTNGVDADAFDFDASSGSFTTSSTNHGIAGIELTFLAIVASSTGELNATTSNFGINAAETGDDTDELDAVLGMETMRISFVAPAHVTNITLQSITIGSFGASDSGTVTIGANSSSIAAGTSTVIPVHSNLDGQFLEVAYTGSATGFGFNGLTLDVTAVPEPRVALLGGVSFGVIGLSAVVKRFFGKKHSHSAA